MPFSWQGSRISYIIELSEEEFIYFKPLGGFVVEKNEKYALRELSKQSLLLAYFKDDSSITGGRGAWPPFPGLLLP